MKRERLAALIEAVLALDAAALGLQPAPFEDGGILIAEGLIEQAEKGTRGG